MDKIANQEFFSAIVSSNILAPYLEQDAALAQMIKTPEHPDIHYFEHPAPAKDLAPGLKHRLTAMIAKNLSHNLEATKRLVAFMEEHPDSLIYNVTFNGPARHYGVRCGWIGDQLYVICVMTGGHLSNEMLGEAIK